MLETAAIILLVILDQAVKYLVKTNIPLGGSVPFLPGILGLTHIHNEGAAFSMLTGARWFFVVLTVVFLVFGLWVLWKKKLRHPLGIWSWVLVLAGAAGNLIDRCLYGYVVDMFDLQFISYPIFNLADCFVVVGVILGAVYYLWFYDKYDKKEPKDDAASES